MAARVSEGEVPVGEVGGEDGPFVAGAEDGYDAAEARGGTEVGEEVEGEAGAGVEG